MKGFCDEVEIGEGVMVQNEFILWFVFKYLCEGDRVCFVDFRWSWNEIFDDVYQNFWWKCC